MEGIRRGYNVLIFEGPGQGEVIRVQHIPFRADWENVIGPVVDYAAERPDVDEDRIALWGISLGGYLAPRGAVYEPGIAALVADGGTYDVGENLLHNLQEGGGAPANLTEDDLQEWLQTDPAEFNDAIRDAMAHDTGTRWLNENGMFVFNATSPAEFWAKWMDFSLVGIAEEIRCPTLVCAGGPITSTRTGCRHRHSLTTSPASGTSWCSPTTTVPDRTVSSGRSPNRLPPSSTGSTTGWE